MQLMGQVRVLGAAGFGAFHIQASASELGMIGRPSSRIPGRSIVGIKAGNLSPDRRSLTFALNDAALLNLGDVDDCIAVMLEAPSTAKVDRPDTRFTQGSTKTGQHLRTGDEAFIEACCSEGLPGDIVILGRRFLTCIRDFSDDALQEGLARKWVTYPRNFLAITIQNRNQQFCIHVKKSPALSALSDRLDIRDDRPGYVRFWLQDDAQLDAAVKAARASFDL